jgi:hypothetical protein
MKYNFLAKDLHRLAVLGCFKWNCTAPILYLDGEEGEATEFFREMKVPKKYLKPVNMKWGVIDHIKSTYGVQGICGDINTIIYNMANDSCSVIWLDYMCTYNDNYLKIIKQSLCVAKYVLGTFSTIMVANKQKVIDHIGYQLGKFSQHEDSGPSAYKGAGGKENMLKFGPITRRPVKSVDSEQTMESDSLETESTISSQGHTFEDHTSEHHIDIDVGSKVLVDYRGTWLTAVVTETSDDSFFVLFDYDGKEKEMPKCKVILNTETIDTSSMIGKEIAMPVCLWKDISGYKEIKRNRKKLCFKIGSRYYKKDHLKIYGIYKDGKIHKQAEKWLISPEQAKCWIVAN